MEPDNEKESAKECEREEAKKEITLSKKHWRWLTKSKCIA